MVQAQHLHSRESPVITTPPSGMLYYAHVVALLVLYCLWRFPAVSTKRNANEKGTKNTTTKKTTIENNSKDGDELCKLCPNSTPEERKRFLSARGGNVHAAKNQLCEYVAWREKHDAIDKELEYPEVLTDEDDWNRAVSIALISCEEDLRDACLPRLARVYVNDDGDAVRDRDGYRILHVMPGQMDIHLAKASTYAVALALYIDRKLERTLSECLTVALDCRGGQGWHNIPPLRQLPFIQTVVKLLLAMFPERLHQCLLFPVPPAALWIWNIAKGYVDPLTASKVNLLAGPARIVSEPPFEAMEEFLTPEVAKRLESERHASFKHDDVVATQ